MRHTDNRPAAGAATAASGGAAEVDAALELVEEGLGRLARVDATTLPDRCVTDTVRRLGRLDGRVDGVQARFVAAAEAAGVPERSGASSTTNWVSQQTGRAGGQAARTSRLAKAADTSPELADAVANGDIGPDQANTIAAGLERAELDPEDVAELLPVARRQSPGMFGRHTRQLAGRRRQQKLRDQELVARAERYHREWRTPNGSLRYEGQLPPAEGDLMEKARSGFYQTDSKDIPDDQRRTHDQRSADAMTAMLRAALRSGEAGDVGGVRPHVDVAVPMEAMAPLHDAEAAGTTAVTDLGTVLSMAAFKKLACDASFRRVVVDPDSRPLDVGRATRQWSPAIRAAIAAIDGGCRGPGCDLPPHRCIVHHIRWWRAGGETSADNGVMLCGHHHDLVHDDGWTLRMDPATRRCTWTAPDGTVIVTGPHGPAARGATLGEPGGRAESHSTTAEPVVRSSRSERPPGRDDPGRPLRSGSDPPRRGRADHANHADREDRDDRAPPEAGRIEPLRLEL